MFKRLFKRFLSYIIGEDIDTLLRPEKPQLYFYSEKGFAPLKGTPGALCYDITPFLPNGDIILNPGEVTKIHTGLYVELPPDYDLFIRDRSGNATNKRILLANRVAVIDNDYRGEILVAIKNDSDEPLNITNAFKLAQIELKKRSPEVEWVQVYSREELSITERGVGGFGSTGDNTHY